MAFGITPRHTRDITFEAFTPEQILIIAMETAKTLHWNLGHISENGFIAYTQFSMSSVAEEVTVKIDGHRVALKSECTGSQMFDWGKNKQNIDEFLETFQKQIGTLTAEDITAKLQELRSGPDLKEPLSDEAPQTSRDKIRSFFSIFIPVEGYFITPVILNLNILLFMLMALSGVNIMLPDNESLINWGANFRPATMEGQAWRLLTCCFIHIGIIHLLMNLYALLYIGVLLEPRLGKTRFLSAYILSGIGGSVASLYWHDLTISAGASGAIFGMYGVFLAMLTTNLIEKAARQAFLTSIIIFVGYNLLNGLKGGIDNAAHIGGLITGIFMGYAFYPSLLKPAALNLKYLTVALLAVLILSSSFFVYTQTPNDIGQYEKKMERFMSLESMALEGYKEMTDDKSAEALKAIKDRGVHHWKECINVINEAEKLDIPEMLHIKNQKLIEYCELRIKSDELLYKAMTEDSDQYQNEIDEYNHQIGEIIDELNKGL